METFTKELELGVIVAENEIKDVVYQDRRIIVLSL